MMATIAITGGTGFVGSRLIALAVEAGHDVRALTRREQAERKHVAWIPGDLDATDALARLCEGADAVIHVAGVVNARDRAGFAAGNIHGTRNILAAAEGAGVRRFVHVSSLAAREPGMSDYGWSKAEAERLVEDSLLDTAMVRPPAIYGPGDMVLSDEAHSMGFYGPNGRGVYEEQGCEGDVDFIVGTFSKSVGTVGGFCVSNHPKFEAIRLACRPYIFTASLPPSVVATAAASIRKLRFAHNKRAHLWENARTLHGGLKEMGFRLGTEKPDSAIIAVILEDQEQAVTMWQALLDGGLYVNMARPPATPAGTYLLRCSLCAEHTAEQVTRILEMFRAAGRSVGVIS